MRFILLLLLIVSFISCSRTDDDQVNQCSENCTTITGNIVRDNNFGIANATVEFFFETRGTHSVDRRIIARGNTNDNGAFTLKGYINQDELGETDGQFGIWVKEKSLPEIFIKNKPFERVDGHGAGVSTRYEKNIKTIFRRDTLINFNCIIPLKQSFVFNVSNFDPTVESNSIEINSYLNADEHTTEGEFNIYNSFSNLIDQTNFTVEAFGAKNLSNKLYIRKRKNGETETEVMEITLTESQTNQINIEF